MARRYSRRSGGARRNLERRFERTTYALILVVLLLTLIVPGLRADFVTLVAGAILTGSAIYQANRRWSVNPLTWIAGVLLLVMGFIYWQSSNFPGGITFPLVVMGGVIVLGAISGDL